MRQTMTCMKWAFVLASVFVIRSEAHAQAPLQLKWQGSPHVFELTFSGGMANGGIKYIDKSPGLPSPEVKMIYASRPLVLPIAPPKTGEYSAFPTIGRDPNLPAHVMVTGSAQVLYFNKQGLSMVLPSGFADGSTLVVQGLGHENILVQYQAREDKSLKTFVFVDGRLSEVSGIKASISKAELKGDTLIIDGKDAGNVRSFDAIEPARAFKGLTAITLSEYAERSAAVIEQARRERAGAESGKQESGKQESGKQEGAEKKPAPAKAKGDRLTGEEIAQKQGRVHPSQLDLTVNNNDGEAVQVWEVVSRFAVDAHEKYQGAEYFNDPDLRKREDALLEALLGSEISSAKFLAEAGSGKSALFRNLMARIAKGDIPDRLKKYTFIEVSPSQMGGDKYQGSGAALASAALALAEQNVILIVDEAHQLAALSKDGGSGPTEIWKPALADGRMKSVMISTPGEWEFAFSSNPAWDSRFQLVTGGEPPRDQLIGIAKNWAKTRRGVEISDEVAKLVIDYSNRYDAIGAQPRRLVRLQEKIFSMKEMANDKSPVTIENVKLAAQKLYQLPATLFDHELRKEQMRQMRAKFADQFVGHDYTVREMIDGEKEILAGANDPTKPGHLGILAGPQGQGMDLALNIYSDGTGRKLFKISGADYQRAEDGDKFRREIGKAFQNTGFVALYFDKVDLLHPDVRQILKKLLQDGRIGVPTGSVTNPTIVTVNARNAALFMSTNLAASTIAGLKAGPSFDDDAVRRELIADGFDASLLESAGVKVLPFHRLDVLEFKRVVEMRIRRILDEYARSQDPIHLEFPAQDVFAEEIAKQFWTPELNVARSVGKVDAQIRRQVGLAIVDGDGSRELTLTYKNGELEATKSAGGGKAGGKCIRSLEGSKGK